MRQARSSVVPGAIDRYRWADHAHTDARPVARRRHGRGAPGEPSAFVPANRPMQIPMRRSCPRIPSASFTTTRLGVASGRISSNSAKACFLRYAGSKAGSKDRESQSRPTCPRRDSSEPAASPIACAWAKASASATCCPGCHANAEAVVVDILELQHQMCAGIGCNRETQTDPAKSATTGPPE
jgi:hypothetical protein